jgi:hypothetical protein
MAELGKGEDTECVAGLSTIANKRKGSVLNLPSVKMISPALVFAFFFGGFFGAEIESGTGAFRFLDIEPRSSGIMLQSSYRLHNKERIDIWISQIRTEFPVL